MFYKKTIFCYIYFFSLLLCIVSIPTNSFALLISELTQKEFVESLYDEKDYFRAITEAKRYLFMFPTGGYKEDMLMLIADSYREGGDEKQALIEYKKILENFYETSYAIEVLHKIGRLHADNRQYILAFKYFEEIQKHPFATSFEKDKASKWLVMLSLLIGETADETNERVRKYRLEDNMDIEALVTDYEKLNIKSPKLAGFLSGVLPGAGQLYVGRKRDALTALILNGLFIWGATEAFNDDKVGIGVLLTVFEIGWYSGNIHTAVSGAHKHNRKLNDSFRKNMSLRMNIYAKEDRSEKVAGIFYKYHF